MWRKAGLWAAVVLAAIAGWWSLAAFRPVTKPEVCRPPHRFSDNPANARLVDSAVRLLCSGDIALRTGTDIISVMLRGMNLRDKTYSHCGIVMIEDGYPFVYHSIGGEDDPDARLARDSAKVFFLPGPNERLGIARLSLSEAQIGRLRCITGRYYSARPRFDLDFDLTTDDKLYCAEFVYKAVREAVADTGYFATTRLLHRHYVAIDNLCDPRHAAMVCDAAFKL